MITRIHVNSQNVKKNPKNLPVFVAQANGRERHGHTVYIDGPSTLLYAPDHPLPGKYEAVAWIETTAEVTVYDANLKEVK